MTDKQKEEVKAMYDDGWWSKRAGFVLSHNNLVPDSFEIGQEIEIID